MRFVRILIVVCTSFFLIVATFDLFFSSCFFFVLKLPTQSCYQNGLFALYLTRILYRFFFPLLLVLPNGTTFISTLISVFVFRFIKPLHLLTLIYSRTIYSNSSFYCSRSFWVVQFVRFYFCICMLRNRNRKSYL